MATMRQPRRSKKVCNSDAGHRRPPSSSRRSRRFGWSRRPPTLRHGLGVGSAGRFFDSYLVRVVAAMLLVSIPVSIALGFMVATWSAQTITDQAQARAQATAESTSVRITDWVAERQSELRIMAPR